MLQVGGAAASLVLLAGLLLYVDRLWNSTGRLVQVRMVAISPNRVSYTYTFTENQMWFKKGTEPGAAPNRRPARRRAVRAPRRGCGR